MVTRFHEPLSGYVILITPMRAVIWSKNQQGKRPLVVEMSDCALGKKNATLEHGLAVLTREL